MKIAVEGCAHGELDKIYEAVDRLEKDNNIKIDLLIICGDFQAVRNPTDLKCMAVPPKFQKLNTFYKYYSGEMVAPVLTIFVGGNHEASNYLSELYYGGWVCPNIYYMGCASVVNIGGIRIAGLSGIYKGHDYLKGHFECPPYDQHTKRSVYHVRNIDVFRLKQLKQPIDICVSHDWPKGIYNNGNVNELLRRKPFFKDEVSSNKLGSPPAEELLYILKPSYWFAAHLHCKFAALVPHEIKGKKSFTKFLALDKCLPRRKFLQVLDMGSSDPSSFHIEYDPEWLCILQSTNHLLSTSKNTSYMPGTGCSQRWDFTVTEEELEAIMKLFNGDFIIPKKFAITAPIHRSSESNNSGSSILKPHINPQTTKFCNILQIKDPFEILINNSSENSLSVSEFSFSEASSKNSTQTSFNPDEISLSDSESEGDEANLLKEEKIEIEQSNTDIFFIDRKRTTDSFEISNAHTSQHCSTPVNNSASSILDFKFPELKEESEIQPIICQNEAASEESDDMPVKKFKRRNQSLYTNTEDD